ncbi:hypothetical protein JHK87_029157 [Glycine soja]|nr:hypothetical protein JHK87_029157 [Glycine soja]
MGVIMFDLPNCPKKRCQLETSSVNGEGSSTHTVTASFETALSIGEFKELLRKISENPDTVEGNLDLSEFSSECESESGSEFDSVSQKSDLNCQDLDSKISFLGASQRKNRRRKSLENRIKLVDMMIERLKCLQEDELSSLATIIATNGLNAALAEVQNSKPHTIQTLLLRIRPLRQLIFQLEECHHWDWESQPWM